MWNCALELIKSEPILEVGTGDVEDELQKCYTSNQYTSLTYWTDTRFNAHNQFLETAIGLGIPGLILLLSCFIIALYQAYMYKNIMYVIFIVLFAVSCLTESMLERQNGVVFYAFFNSLFAFNKFK